ncbi:ATP adenylyltransferase [compost metagenome]
MALLNKFSVIEHHLLIVTRCFEPQESLLTVPDFAALLACMAEFPSLGFYNGGPVAGASQAHKHLQLVPLPLAEGKPVLPIDTVLQPARIAGAPGTIRAVPGLPFAHAFAPLDLVAAPLHEMARTACLRYRALLDSAGVRAQHADGAVLQSAPYNLLVMPAGLLLVRRARECVEGISLNALAFAGSLFVRDAAQRRTVERLGPMSLLRRAAADGENACSF